MEEWFDYGVEGMKKDEIALLMIENLKKDQNDMKVLDNKSYYYIELIDWTTIIGKLRKNNEKITNKQKREKREKKNSYFIKKI